MTTIQRETAKLYKGLINWKGEIMTVYTHAHTLSKAKSQILKQAADKLDVPIAKMRVKVSDGVSLLVKECKRTWLEEE